MSLGETLRTLRDAAGLSQAQLAALTGVSRNAVSQWEAGATQPSTKRLMALAAALGVPLDAILVSKPAGMGPAASAAQRGPGWEDAVAAPYRADAGAQPGLRSGFSTADEVLVEVLRASDPDAIAGLALLPPPEAGPIARLEAALRLRLTYDLRRARLTAAAQVASWDLAAAPERVAEEARVHAAYRRVVVEVLQAARTTATSGQAHPTESRPVGELDAATAEAAGDLVLAAYTQVLGQALTGRISLDTALARLGRQVALVVAGVGAAPAPSPAGHAARPSRKP